MNRYEFEILAYIDKEGKKEYDTRILSNELRISASTAKVVLDKLMKMSYINKTNGTLSVTKKGYEALEPYRVNKAIILAAGFGSRMMPATADRPKPLVSINGVRILDTLLDAFIKVGIKDITIVRGYKKECFDELLTKYPSLTLVDNDIYARTNNISSVMKVLDKICHCYLCEADLYIMNPEIIKKYQYTSNILGAYSLETDDWSFRMDEKGCITNYQKGNTHCYNYYGISYWTQEDGEKLQVDFEQVYKEPGGEDYFWEFVPLVLRKDRYQVEIRHCEKADIMEIDNYYELAQLDPSYINTER